MEENFENATDEKLIQENETIQLLTTALNEKTALVDSLQMNKGAESEAVDQIQINKQKQNQDNEKQCTNIEDKGLKINKLDLELKNWDEDDAADVLEAVATSLKNPAILTTILKKLRTRDLLYDCRLVNREWRDLSTEILLSRNCLHVELRIDSFRSQVFAQPRNQDLTLRQLTGLLSTFKKYPCTRFTFNGNLNVSDAQRFLRSRGSIVKGLKLIGSQNCNCVRKTLGELLPNLKYLELEKVQEWGDPEPMPINFPTLSSLISLKLGPKNSSSLVREIIQAAPNLQHCSGFWSNEGIESLSPRLHILKGLSLRPKKNELETLEQELVTKPLELSYLEVDYTDLGGTFDVEDLEPLNRFDDVNTQLVRQSQTTLRELKLIPPRGNIYLIEWPESGLQNVRRLTLCGDEYGKFRHPTYHISETFPHLHTLCIDPDNPRYHHDKDPTPGLFADDLVLTVQSLTISGQHVNQLESFYRAFPNVTHLSVRKISDFHQVAPKIWSVMSHGLKSLELEFTRQDVWKIDAGFTGLEKSLCELLRKQEKKKIEIFKVLKSRVKPSILNLTGLKELYLFDGYKRPSKGYVNESDEKQSNAASFVSFEYAFKFHPKLRVFPYRFHGDTCKYECSV